MITRPLLGIIRPVVEGDFIHASATFGILLKYRNTSFFSTMKTTKETICSNNILRDQDALSQDSSVRVSSSRPASGTTSCSTVQSSKQGGTCIAVARNTSDLSYDISSCSSEESLDELLDFQDNIVHNNRPPRQKRENTDPCLSFDEECRELLAAANLKDASDVEKKDDGDIEDNDEDSGTEFPFLKDKQPTLETVAKWIKEGECRNIVVLSGAGVSCSAGIPDFRTPGTGLYDNLEKYDLPYAEAVFDLSFYQVNPQPFVSLAAELWPGLKHSPTISHSFIALLESKKLLVRNYTQNIDGLEVLAGVSEDKLVECHGHFRTASCISCGIPFDGKECKRLIVEERTPPICPKCSKGLVKPDIVFFGESLPVRFGKSLHGDLSYADLLIVMGTSLKVAPVSLIPEMVSTRCPRVLINRELVGDFVPPGVDGNFRDVFAEGNCDDTVIELCKLIGWDEELEKLHASSKLGND